MKRRNRAKNFWPNNAASYRFDRDGPLGLQGSVFAFAEIHADGISSAGPLREVRRSLTSCVGWFTGELRI